MRSPSAGSRLHRARTWALHRRKSAVECLSLEVRSRRYRTVDRSVSRRLRRPVAVWPVTSVGFEPLKDLRQSRPLLHTFGHSTRCVEELIELLEGHDIELLADVRTLPRSRSNPQFNSDALPATLAPIAIRYLHIAELGGLRKPHRDSAKYGLAKCQLPRLYRLHGDQPVPHRG